jgi:hypothetical protein
MLEVQRNEFGFPIFEILMRRRERARSRRTPQPVRGYQQTEPCTVAEEPAPDLNEAWIDLGGEG